MARFYGWTPDEVYDLDVQQMSDFVLGMEQIECQEALLDIKIVSYPYTKKDSQSSFHRKLHNKAYPQEQKPMTMERLAEMLSGE